MMKASVCFSIMAMCVKWASSGLPSFEIVFFRSLLGTLMILPLLIAKKVSFVGKAHGILLLRGTSGFVALTLFFYTLTKLPLGTAVILNYTSPIFSAILATLFLKERPGIITFFMTLISFLGVYLLVDSRLPGSGLPVLLGLLSAVAAGVAYVSIRAIKHRESPLTVIFYFTLISTVGSAGLLSFGFRWPTPIEWLALAGVGIGAFYGQLWMTISLRRAPASLVGPFSYLSPLLSFIYGLLFWGERLSWKALSGAFLIILGGAAITYFGSGKKSK